MVNGTRAEAQKGLKGLCPNCQAELSAKCGGRRNNHWAHKGSRNCDPWWEPETEWHRFWKNKYDIKWQEVVIFDENTGEKHIADIKTNYGLVLEFQHSHLSLGEQTKREAFYKNMIWVVDGARLKRDYSRFYKTIRNISPTSEGKLLLAEFADEVFPKNWLTCTSPVVFDFRGNELLVEQDDLRNHIFCLLPSKKQITILDRHFIRYSRDNFINLTISGEWQSEILSWQNDPNINKPIRSFVKQPIKAQNSPHYYDSKRGAFIKRRRF